MMINFYYKIMFYILLFGSVAQETFRKQVLDGEFRARLPN